MRTESVDQKQVVEFKKDSYTDPTVEVEFKYCSEFPDPNIAQNIREHFEQCEFLKIYHAAVPLNTRQFDTMDKTLDSEGFSLRTRSTFREGIYSTPDVCLKSHVMVTPDNATTREEYETGQAEFGYPDIPALLSKYNVEGEHDHIQFLFNGIVKDEEMFEHFRIDCQRTRYVIGVPVFDKYDVSEVFYEVNSDDSMFLFDITADNGDTVSVVLGHDLEVEGEPLFKPCSFDRSENAADFVTNKNDLHLVGRADKKLKSELDTVFRSSDVVKNGDILMSVTSKADRGFGYLNKFEESYLGGSSLIQIKEDANFGNRDDILDFLRDKVEICSGSSSFYQESKKQYGQHQTIFMVGKPKYSKRLVSPVPIVA